MINERKTSPKVDFFFSEVFFSILGILENFSAFCWVFGRKLYTSLNVPIGILELKLYLQVKHLKL